MSEQLDPRLILQDLGAPVWTSALLERIRTKGPARASADDWLRFISASREQGISQDEIRFSQVANTLASNHTQSDVLTRQQVLSAVLLKPLMPRLQLSVDDSFRPTDSWVETAMLIPNKQHKKRGLHGAWPESSYVVRYRHRSLGWSLVLARHSDLFVRRHERRWLVLDPHGARAADQPALGFTSAQEAMAHAAMRMQRPFSRSAKGRHTPRWERFSLQGLGAYAELLVTLPAWPGSFNSKVHFPGVHNLLVHLRTNACDTGDGRRVLFLDEVQSDWHAMLAAQRGQEDSAEVDLGQGAPFARDWPLLAMKFALWWAARKGLSGVAWSPPELHLRRWPEYHPPTEVYRRALPEAAAKLARTLPLELATTWVLRRRIRPNKQQQWQVLNKTGSPVCKPFTTRQQAESFADLTGARWRHEFPVLWIASAHPLDRMPLFGVGAASLWSNEANAKGAGGLVQQDAAGRRVSAPSQRE